MSSDLRAIPGYMRRDGVTCLALLWWPYRVGQRPVIRSSDKTLTLEAWLSQGWEWVGREPPDPRTQRGREKPLARRGDKS